MPEYISAISNERVALVHADTTRFDALAESFSAQLAASGSNTEQAPARDPHPLHPLGAGARILYDLNAAPTAQTPSLQYFRQIVLELYGTNPAEAAKVLGLLRTVGKYVGPAAIGFGGYFAIQDARNANPQDQARVAARGLGQLIGGFAGNAAGLSALGVGGAFALGLGLATPPGWVVIGLGVLLPLGGAIIVTPVGARLGETVFDWSTEFGQWIEENNPFDGLFDLEQTVKDYNRFTGIDRNPQTGAGSADADEDFGSDFEVTRVTFDDPQWVFLADPAPSAPIVAEPDAPVPQAAAPVSPPATPSPAPVEPEPLPADPVPPPVEAAPPRAAPAPKPEPEPEPETPYGPPPPPADPDLVAMPLPWDIRPFDVTTLNPRFVVSGSIATPANTTPVPDEIRQPSGSSFPPLFNSGGRVSPANTTPAPDLIDLPAGGSFPALYNGGGRVSPANTTPLPDLVDMPQPSGGGILPDISPYVAGLGRLV